MFDGERLMAGGSFDYCSDGCEQSHQLKTHAVQAQRSIRDDEVVLDRGKLLEFRDQAQQLEEENESLRNECRELLSKWGEMTLKAAEEIGGTLDEIRRHVHNDEHGAFVSVRVDELSEKLRNGLSDEETQSRNNSIAAHRETLARMRSERGEKPEIETTKIQRGIKQSQKRGWDQDRVMRIIFVVVASALLVATSYILLTL